MLAYAESHTFAVTSNIVDECSISSLDRCALAAVTLEPDLHNFVLRQRRRHNNCMILHSTDMLQRRPWFATAVAIVLCSV